MPFVKRNLEGEIVAVSALRDENHPDDRVIDIRR